jgi:hypothetical protein
LTKRVIRTKFQRLDNFENRILIKDGTQRHFKFAENVVPNAGEFARRGAKKDGKMGAHGDLCPCAGEKCW